MSTLSNITGAITGNKYDPNTDIPDLSGKVFLVTGKINAENLSTGI